MPLHIRFDLAVEIKHVGVLALIGVTKEEFNGRCREATVQFVLQERPDGELTRFFVTSYPFQEEGGLLESFIQEGRQWVTGLNGDRRFLFFERKIKEPLREPKKFLHATADKLYRELSDMEEAELSSREQDAQWDWANANYGSQEPMPDFREPRSHETE